VDAFLLIDIYKKLYTSHLNVIATFEILKNMLKRYVNLVG